MRKSSFGQFGSRLSSGPLRVKNDGGAPRKSTSVGSHTPQSKRYSGVSTYSSAATSRTRSVLGHGSGMGQRSNAPGGMRSSSIGIGAGTSGLGFRGSGIGARSRTDVPKDPRPVSDKGFQHRCIRTLLDFLLEAKYPHPISTKVLQSPPSKEFFRIFEFIYCIMDPNFKLGGKMEEEVPRVFKTLGYPFSISKSSMHAVGTPHTWPTLLAALVWMIDLVKMTHSLGTSQLDQLIFPPDDENFTMPDDKIKFQYVSQAYDAYLAGADEFDQLQEELGTVLEDKYLGQSGGVDAVRAENARMAEEMELLDQEMSRVDKLQEQQEIMLLDERKFRDYLNELDNVNRKHQHMLVQAEEEHNSLDQELKSVKTKNQHMQAMYDQQELTLADVERLRAAKQELQRTEEGLEKEVEAIDNDIWKNEMSLARRREQIDASFGEYSRLVRAFHLIPSTSEVANGINFDIRPSDPDVVNKLESITPALIAMKGKGWENLQQLEGNKLREQNRLEHKKEHISGIQEEIASLEKVIKGNDRELECRRELYQRDIDNLQGEIDTLQEEVRTQQTSSHISLQDAERELRQAETRAKGKEAEELKKEQEYANFFRTFCTMVIDHKDHVQQQLSSLEKDVAQTLKTEQERCQRMELISRNIREQQ